MNKKLNTLVYVRRSKVFNDAVLSYANNNLASHTIETISEYYNGDYRIDMNVEQWDYCYKTQQFIENNLDLSKVIFRDRVLRNTPFKKSLLLVRRATGNIINCISSNNFDILVTYPVDNYITDILVQVAKIHNIKCYGVCNFFMSDYKRITLYGEHNPFREPSSSEVNAVKEKLQKNFRSHMAPNRPKAIRAAIIRYLKYKARYPIFYLFLHKLFRRNEYDLPCTIHNTTVRSFFNFFVERHFVPIKNIDFSKKSILVPLHYFPEATIEYWSDNSSQIEFEDMLYCKVNELSERYEQVILKEHPATLYDNNSNFYKQLMKNPKVVFVDPFVSTSALLERVDILGCWTGTAGIEALVNNKRVELFVNEQYYRQALNLHPEILIQDGELISIKNVSIFLKEILKGCFPIEN